MRGEEKESLRILVFAPHPDDDLIGCGGSMAKHLKNSNEVFVVYTTNGAVETQEIPLNEFIKIRRKETLNVARIIGLEKEKLFFLDEEPWKLNEERIRFAFLKLVRQIKPEVCYVPHSEDAHVDHKIVSQAAIDAINIGPSRWFKPHSSNEQSSFPPIILAYEVWTPLTKPNYFEDITDFLEKKMAALREHKSQRVEEYERAHRGMNAFRGAMFHGVGYAEAFQVLKIQRIFNL